jgi:hypothetical protein
VNQQKRTRASARHAALIALCTLILNARAADPTAPVSSPPSTAAADQRPSNEAEQRAVDALRASLHGLDYQRARYHPIHFKPAIEQASDAECLVCHREVLDTQVRTISPAGLRTDQSLAWYQTLATYDGEQMTFHQRHLTSPYARAVMNLRCNFCHQGNDPRDESPTYTVDPGDMHANNGQEPFTNRKMVNPSETCLRCHGAFPDPATVMNLPGASWPAARAVLENAQQPNGCLLCHGTAIRTVRHRVSYLNAAAIEDLAQESSDVCLGCHGGRAWYRIAYPLPRHAWPGMGTDVPAWARTRPTTSDPRYALDSTP